MYKRIFEDFFNDIDINDEDINKSHNLVTDDEKSHQKYILKTEIEYEYYEHPEQKNENVFYIYKYLLEVFNTLITVDSVSLETKLILNINVDDNNITIDNFIPQKDKTNAFDYFPEYKDNFSWSTTIIYEINIYFNIIVNSTFNQFCTDIDKIDNMLDKIEIGSYILSKTSDEIKNGEYIQSKKYKSNDELVKIYAKLYDKNDDEILSTENSDMYFYRKYKIKDKILDYLKSSELNIVNYDIEIRDFPKSSEIIDTEVYEKKVVLVTVILKTPEKDSVYQLYQNSCLNDLKDQFLCTPKIKNCLKNICRHMIICFRFFGSQKKALMPQYDTSYENLSHGFHYFRHMSSAALTGKKLNRYLRYTPDYDADYSVYVVFPQKDGTLTNGHIDWTYRGERAFAYMFGRLEYNEPDYWEPKNFKKP